MLKLEISYLCIIKLVCICIYPCHPVTAAVNLSAVQVVYMFSPGYVYILRHWIIGPYISSGHYLPLLGN